MKHLLIPLCWFIHFSIYSQEQYFFGKIVDSESLEAISFSTMLNSTDPESGAITNQEGLFRIKKTSNNLFYVSSMGYKDTLVYLNDVNDKYIIKLSKEIVMLKRIEVLGLKMHSDSIIAFEQQLNFNSNVTINQNKAGVGVLYNLTKKAGFLEEVSAIFNSNYPSQYMCQIFSLKEKPKTYKLTNKSNLQKLLAKPIIFNVNRDGIYSIDLEQYNVYFEDEFIAIVYTEIFDKPSAIENDLFQYNLVISNHKNNLINHFYVFSNKFALLDSNDGFPAINLIYSNISKK